MVEFVVALFELVVVAGIINFDDEDGLTVVAALLLLFRMFRNAPKLLFAAPTNSETNSSLSESSFRSMPFQKGGAGRRKEGEVRNGRHILTWGSSDFLLHQQLCVSPLMKKEK